MFHLAIFGENKIDGSTIDPGEQVVGLALFGGLEFDFTECPAPDGAELMIFAIFGGATVKVRQEDNVMLSSVGDGSTLIAESQLLGEQQTTASAVVPCAGCWEVFSF